MHSKSDNIDIMINDKGDEVTEELSLPSRYQIELEPLIENGDFVFGCVCLLYYICHKINTNRVGLYTESSDWIKTKKQL